MIENKELEIDGKTILFELEYKNVKNVNLRVRRDGSVYVSANRRIPKSLIEKFIKSNADFIFTAQEKHKNPNATPNAKYFSDTELRDIIHKICERIYPYYEELGISYPNIKFRKMVSRWGSCCPSKNTVTFNTMLIFAPYECVEYVVFHEFTHFIYANHSKNFYNELELVCPDWKRLKAKLSNINIR